MPNKLKQVPQYVWTILALVVGISSGGLFPNQLKFMGDGVTVFLNGFIKIVPILILFALSPAISNLVKKGKGGKLATFTMIWYVLTSVVAGLIGVLVSSLFFDLSFTSNEGDVFAEIGKMFSALNAQADAMLPLLAILLAVLLGVLAIKIKPLDTVLQKIEKGIDNASGYIGYVMVPLVLFLGISLGVKTGARESFNYYLLISLYTLGMCVVWLVMYLFLVLKLWAKQPIKKILKDYYLPTAVFAAGTCSSLATIPINLNNAKKIGVKKEVADFVIPIGAIVNMDMSAMAYVAYAPFILTVFFDLQVSWSAILVAWPAIVLFTIAAPGLPAGMGTALWSSALFASLLGLQGATKTEFIATWLALSGGIPDMFRTATNCTCDGFTAILCNKILYKSNIENTNNKNT